MKSIIIDGSAELVDWSNDKWVSKNKTASLGLVHAEDVIALIAEEGDPPINGYKLLLGGERSTVSGGDSPRVELKPDQKYPNLKLGYRFFPGKRYESAYLELPDDFPKGSKIRVQIYR